MVEWRDEEFQQWLRNGAPVDTTVTHLYIRKSSCKIENIEVINNLPNLEQLNCSHNKIKTLEHIRLVHLKRLNCSHNKIKKMGRLDMPVLKKLNCSYNLISQLHDLWMPNLTRIYCEHNRGVSLRQIVPHFPSLKAIDCSGCTSTEESSSNNNSARLYYII